jgi:hypothetical protein
MRLVVKHSAIGYVPPQNRDGCRNCKFVDVAEDDRPGFPTRPQCRKHQLEVNAGAICPDHARAGDWITKRTVVMPLVSPKRGFA